MLIQTERLTTTLESGDRSSVGRVLVCHNVIASLVIALSTSILYVDAPRSDAYLCDCHPSSIIISVLALNSSASVCGERTEGYTLITDGLVWYVSHDSPHNVGPSLKTDISRCFSWRSFINSSSPAKYDPLNYRCSERLSSSTCTPTFGWLRTTHHSTSTLRRIDNSYRCSFYGATLRLRSSYIYVLRRFQAPRLIAG